MSQVFFASRRRSIGCLGLVLVLLLRLPVAGAAQTIAGQISGRITDASGGVLPGVTVTVVNDGTGFTDTRVTDASGVYTFTNLRVGTYSVSAELQGFRKEQRTGFSLTADGRLSADFSLGVGEMSESVEVTAVMGETVNRTNGEVARTIDSQQIKDLAFNGRNYLELASLIPGAVATDYDPLALATSLSVTGQSINGSRGNTNNLTVDGASNLDSGSNGSQINNVSLSFIEQVKIQTSNFSSELGRNSGAAVNVVTRSGTNRFQGTARYDFRDEKFDEPNFFAARDANGNRTKPELEFRNFEGAFGGPVLRNRLFFFGGQQYRIINRFTNPSRQTMPSRAELAGDFALRLRGTDNIIGTADDGVLRDPTTGLQFPGNVIPSNRITTDGRAIANTYAKMIDLAAEYTNTPTANNATFQQYNPFEQRQDIIRIDWQATGSQRVHGRYLHDEYDLLDPYGVFSGAPLPTVPTNRSRPGTGYQVGHTWVVRSNLVNEARINAAWNGQRINPEGDTWQRATYGYQFPELFAGGFIDGGIPNVSVTGFPNLVGPSFALLSPTTDITFQDTLTYTRSRHSIRTGVAISRNRKDQNGRAAYLGAASFSTSGNPNSTSNALADALLGNFRTYNEASADPVGFFRFTAYQAFVSDTWRVRSNLSLELGVRYEYVQPTYAQGNNLVNFDPSLYDPAQAVTVLTTGLLVPNSGNRFNGLVTAGDGVPEDQQGRVTLLTGGDYSRIPNGGPRGMYDAQNLFMPRASLAYSLNEATVVRGGVGVFYDKPEGNLIFSQLNIPPILDNVTYENFNIAAPSSGAAGAIGALGDINAIDPNLKLARQTNFSLGVQREIGRGYFVEGSYVGNRGDFLLRQPDINRASFDALRANAALPAAQRVSTNFLRPYKGYSAIRMRLSDAESDYDSLQLYVTKRRGVITFTTSYTLSKVITDASGNGDNDTAEAAGDRSYTRGPASFDRRHAFVGTFTYRVPFLLERGDLLEAIAGGWEVSGKVRAQSGQYYTATGNSSIGGRRANYTGAEIRLDDRNELRWFNTDAFTLPAEDARGTATVGQILGPSFYQWDLSLRKNFRFGGHYQATPIFDVFNLFNRLNFGAPNTDVSNGSYGTINSAQPSRQFQLGVKFEF
jgi:Carboxypeptidase regulatory-like domain/TonB-dependent Receptor Plug Domain